MHRRFSGGEKICVPIGEDFGKKEKSEQLAQGCEFISFG